MQSVKVGFLQLITITQSVQNDQLRIEESLQDGVLGLKKRQQIKCEATKNKYTKQQKVVKEVC